MNSVVYLALVAVVSCRISCAYLSIRIRVTRTPKRSPNIVSVVSAVPPGIVESGDVAVIDEVISGNGPKRLNVPNVAPVVFGEQEQDDDDTHSTNRRRAVLQVLSLSLLSSFVPPSASASPEIDKSGLLFSPKNEMVKGGSNAARGVPLKEVDARKRKQSPSSLLKSTGLLQDVYDTRFITYLARFLLVFDPYAAAWWRKSLSRPDVKDDAPKSKEETSKQQFAEFAESVELGLVDYFLGPYGSYASVAAAKAGISAKEAASSRRDEEDPSIFNFLSFARSRSGYVETSMMTKRKSRDSGKKNDLARQGVLNLFSLLKARYTSLEEKKQLALLFSLVTNPDWQPTKEIQGLLGEIDNASISSIELVDLSMDPSNQLPFRLSSRRGGGFAKGDADNIIRVENPSPLGSDYRLAKVRAILQPTSRILRIKVIDGGLGYADTEVVVSQRGASRCEAAAVLDRNGSVTEVIVLNPGRGYGQATNSLDGSPVLPRVEIKPRRQKKSSAFRPAMFRPARAVAELEYQVVGAEVIDGGTGYLLDRPPQVTLELPESDPDYYNVAQAFSRTKTAYKDEESQQLLSASVTQMKTSSGDLVSTRAVDVDMGVTTLSSEDLQLIRNDPAALLPSDLRPRFSRFDSVNSTNPLETGFYYVPFLPPPSAATAVILGKSFFRSVDMFGGIAKAPVTKTALTLSGDQYLRLALSGAICTVLVRTALNPLELVKTKIQLGNDETILNLAKEKASPEDESVSIGTSQVIQSLIEVRGPLSLFQSADITLITSIVFGLFGFGATELFRRSFSAVFFDESSASGPSEILLLVAAGFATLLTCLAGSPFEILRVRSMSMVESEPIATVFNSFIEENRARKKGVQPAIESSTDTRRFELSDVKPLWSSFNPIVARELPFAVTKFLVFDLAASTIASAINSSGALGDTEIQVGVGTAGLTLSALSGAIAGIFGAFVSHPADLILTLTSASSRGGDSKNWQEIVRELLNEDGGVLNLFAGFPARAVFFFLVIGLQFFLYDYVKVLLNVGSDDLTLVLDVFYAVRKGLV